MRLPAYILLLSSIILIACEKISTPETIEQPVSQEQGPEVDEAEFKRIERLLARGDDQTCDLTLHGEIDRAKSVELAERIRTFASTGLGSRSFEMSATLCLNSKGGQIANARIVRDAIGFAQQEGFGILTVVKSGHECLSACALLFMSGFDCFRQFCGPARSISANARLGFHTPFFGINTLEGGDRFLAATYEGAIRDLGEFLVLGRDSVIPSFLLAEILRTPNDEFFYIDTVAKAIATEIAVFDIRSSFTNRDALIYFCANHFALANGAEKIAYTNYLYGLRVGAAEIPLGTTFEEFEEGAGEVDILGGDAGSIESFSYDEGILPPDIWSIPPVRNEDYFADSDFQPPFLLVHYPTYAWDFNLIYSCLIFEEFENVRVHFLESDVPNLIIPEGVAGPARGYRENANATGLVSQSRASRTLSGWLSDNEEQWIFTWPPQTFLQDIY